jgi:hypothetical protein
VYETDNEVDFQQYPLGVFEPVNTSRVGVRDTRKLQSCIRNQRAMVSLAFACIVLLMQYDPVDIL